MPYLTVRGPDGRRIHELEAEAVIGRGVSCHVLLDDPRSSKRHAMIREMGGRYLLQDLGSTNGSHLSGDRIEGEVSLQDGDEIVIGDTTLVFTRTLPPGVEPAIVRSSDDKAKEEGSDVGSLKDKSGLRVPESSVTKIPKGTMVVPLERFGLRSTATKGYETTVFAAPDATLDLGMWLRSLYRLLREANQCDTEDELFAAATRVLGEALPGSRVRVAFEADELEADAKGKAAKGKTMSLAVWSDPTRRTGKTTRIIDDELAQARTVLLTHARERGVAVLSPDLEADTRVTEAGASKRKSSRAQKDGEADEDVDRTSLLIAPLLRNRASLGFLVVERKYWPESSGRGKRSEPFNQAHLEFLAAAAYPLATMLENLRRRQNVLNQNQRLRDRVIGKHEIVGQSSSLKRVMDIVQRVAAFDSPVLILGESGTGKELTSRAVHAMSPRAQGPFEAINCAALPENLVESELFGHAKGAFTGASSDRPGIFEVASGGTLFLDEVGELPLPVQAKLLRVLEESKISRVGESRLRDIDCRILCATNRDLAQDVEESTFRRDLYYRLRVMEIVQPPLRERREDLPILCQHLLSPFGNFTLKPDVLEVFWRYWWPGNIRELRNTLERMAVMAKPSGRGMTKIGHYVLGVEDIPLDIRRAVESSADVPAVPVPRPDSAPATAFTNAPSGVSASHDTFVIHGSSMPALEDLQVDYAKWVLEQVSGNKTQAAKVLGIQRSTLYSWTEWNDKKKKKSGA